MSWFRMYHILCTDFVVTELVAWMSPSDSWLVTLSRHSFQTISVNIYGFGRQIPTILKPGTPFSNVVIFR